MFTRLHAAMVAAGALVVCGCADVDDVPRVVRDAVKNVPYAEGSAVTCMVAPVEKDFRVTFLGDESAPITIPAEGFLVWIDENKGVRWPHKAKLVWVPKAPDQVQRVLKQGVITASFKITRADDTSVGRMTWISL